MPDSPKPKRPKKPKVERKIVAKNPRGVPPSAAEMRTFAEAMPKGNWEFFCRWSEFVEAVSEDLDLAEYIMAIIVIAEIKAGRLKPEYED